MTKLKKIMLGTAVVMGLGSVPDVRAVSYGDRYVELQIGALPREKRFESTLLGGYSFYDEFGAGLFYDMFLNGFQAGGEVRWFFEPFEVGVGLGSSYDNREKRYHFLMAPSVAYLWAVSSKLACKVDFRGQFFLSQKSTLYTSAGFRYLF